MRSQRAGSTGRSGAWYALFSSLVLVCSLAGYFGYVLYPRFDLPAAFGIGLLVLSAGAGVAALFSPCSFPLLVTLLSRETAAHKAENQLPPIREAASFSIGVALFLVIAGLLIAAGADAWFESVTFTSAAGRLIRLSVGVLLIFLALVQRNVIPISFYLVEEAASPLIRAQARLRRARPSAGYGLFGFGYVLAGFG